MSLSVEKLRKFQPCKLFSDGTQKIESLNYSPSGEFLSATSPGLISLYSCITAEKTATINRYENARDSKFYLGSTNLLVNTRNELHLYSTTRSAELCTLQGHTNDVSSFSISATNGLVLTCSHNDSVMLWSVDSARPKIGCVNVKGTVAAAFDHDGTVFALCTEPNTIRLYDVRSYSKGPFSTSSVEEGAWLGVSFSDDGRMVLLSRTTGFDLYDATDTKNRIARCSIETSSACEHAASLSPDSRFVVSGSPRGEVYVWSTEGGACVQRFETHKSSSIALFNPRYVMMASACTNLVMWQPVEEALEA